MSKRSHTVCLLRLCGSDLRVGSVFASSPFRASSLRYDLEDGMDTKKSSYRFGPMPASFQEIYLGACVSSYAGNVLSEWRRRPHAPIIEEDGRSGALFLQNQFCTFSTLHLMSHWLFTDQLIDLLCNSFTLRENNKWRSSIIILTFETAKALTVLQKLPWSAVLESPFMEMHMQEKRH